MDPDSRHAAHCVYDSSLKAQVKKCDLSKKSSREIYIIQNRITPVMEIIDQIDANCNGLRQLPASALELESRWIANLLNEGHPLTNRITPTRPEIKYRIGETIK
jgi:hypothetical protein